MDENTVETLDEITELLERCILFGVPYMTEGQIGVDKVARYSAGIGVDGMDVTLTNGTVFQINVTNRTPKEGD